MKLYNTKSQQIEDFKPINDNKVLLYTCGPTVYNSPHVGNWVSFLRWDILVRTLMINNYTVTRVMNITDVGHLTSDEDEGEDKMQKGARREGITAWDVAKKYTDEFMQGMHNLNCIMPTYITNATDFIEEQIKLVKVLQQKGYTYVIEDGVYFDTNKFNRYADFAHLDLDAIKKGARVEYNQQKRNPSDFALWKFSPKNQERDMEWQSPWGVGFPGWHLECSAMALAKLGPTIDIHTGGIDHIQVHHTNEIAQSECANDAPFANYWLHNNHMLSNGTKISKSLNNGYTLNDIYEKGYTANDFRMFLLQSHYRTESNFSWENLQSAKNRLTNWANIACLKWQVTDNNSCYAGQYSNAITKITNALSNDLDTPTALVEAEKALNYAEENGITTQTLDDFTKFLEHIQNAFGLKIECKDIANNQKQILDKRSKARANKNWQESDSLRNQLLEQGVEVKDTKFGQIWSYIL